MGGLQPTRRRLIRRLRTTPTVAPTRRPAPLQDEPAGGALSLARSVHHPERLDAQSLLALQQCVGNSAVQRLLRLVQRDPLSKDDDPEGYTSKAGKADVAGSGTTRREVHDLKFGVSGGFKKSYTSTTYPKGLASEERGMTKESPDNMAVVIMPDKLEKPDKRPVQVILHFAGWGFRGGDPYAGYTVASGYKRGKKEIKQGSVRDVDQEHWEQQIGALNQERAKASGPQTVAILAQGRGMSDFGNVPTFDYVQDVFSHVTELSGVQQYSLVLSAHSGGGGTQIAPKLKQGDAQTDDRSKPPKAKEGTAAQQPTDLVVMFDAEGIESVAGWATNQIAALATSIKSAATPADARAAIAATPKFRGYYAVNGHYEDRYTTQHKVICKALAQVPAEWAFPDASNPTQVAVADLFRIVPVSGKGVDHEHVISGGPGEGDQARQGALSDALRASADPTIDRDAGLPCEMPSAKSKSRKK